MPLMKKPAILMFCLAALGVDANAKAYFQTKDEMIERAEAIAVIQITGVGPATAAGQSWTYGQTGKAAVLQSIKGNLPEKFKIYGSENFICARCPLANGTYLAFLKKDGSLWTGSNWHLSLRPIKERMVDWFTGDDRYDTKPAPLERVLKQLGH